MNMFNRSHKYVGDWIKLRTKTGDNHSGKLEAVDIDGEMSITDSNTVPGATLKVFINTEQVESLSYIGIGK